MARYQVTSSVDAKKLHPRSGIPLSEPAVLLPFGAILENLREDRDLYKFSYLGQPYQCEQKALKPAIRLLDGAAADPAPAPSVEVLIDVPAPPAGGPSAAPPEIRWSGIRTSHGTLLRARIPGGWLVMQAGGHGLTFVPDSGHAWDGTSLD